jgi:serine/threonine protein kinase
VGLKQHYGAYRIEAEIARGGQGVVLRARHVELGKRVALKLLLDDDLTARKRFLREVKTLAALRHVNLPQAYDVGEEEGVPWIALELIEGQSLKERLREHGVPDFAWSVQVVASVARAVHYCHEQAILHRDLKPANVVIEQGSERPVVVDFGLVKLDPQLGVESLSQTGEIQGTPSYMAPEQIGVGQDGRGVSLRSDVYGLGGILYFLLTGEPPFDGPANYNVITKVVQDPTPDPRAANPQVPAVLARECLKAMAKSPAGRHESARDFAQAIEDALAGGGDAPLVPKWLVAGLLLALLVVGGVLASGSRQPAPTPTPEPVAAAPSASEAATPAEAPAPVASPSAPPSASLEPEPPVTLRPGGPPGGLSVSHALAGGPYEGSLRLGPWLVQALRPKPNTAYAMRIEGGEPLELPPGCRPLAWDAARERFLAQRAAKLVAVTPEGEVSALADTGAVRWSVAAEELLVVGLRDGRLLGLAPDGSPRWESARAPRVDGAPALLDLDGDGRSDHAILGDAAGQVRVLGLADGQETGRLVVPGTVRHTPVVTPGTRAGEHRVLIGCAEGTLVWARVDGQGGIALASARALNSALVAPPVIWHDGPDDRRIFAATLHGVGCLSEDLSTVAWVLGSRVPRAWPRGDVVLTDLDQDGEPEVACCWVEPPPPSPGKKPLVPHVVSVCKARTGEVVAMLDPGGWLQGGTDRALASAFQGAFRVWGPWSGFPETGGSWQPRDSGETAGPWWNDQAPEPLRLRGPEPRPRSLPDLAPWPEGGPRSVRFRKRKPPLGNGIELVAAGNPGQLAAGEWLRAGFTLDRSRAYELVLRHVAPTNFRHSATTLELVLDDEPILGGLWLAPGTRETERFELGTLEAGEHVVGIRVRPESHTLYVPQELWIKPRD